MVAALEAINGINLFGARGGPSSVIHVLQDEIMRNYVTLYTALPFESPSKEVDGAILSVIGFPAFAIHDSLKITKTRNEIIKKLEGRYGMKRFLRDGHQTVLENTTRCIIFLMIRLHYELAELKIFEDIESEWPLFFTYMILEGLFRNDMKQVEEYRAKLEPILVQSHDVKELEQTPMSPLRSSICYQQNKPCHKPFKLVPELYIVPKDKVDAEKADPGSQDRNPNENLPLVWAQSLYILGNLIYDNLLSPADIDPLGRRNLPYGRGRQDLVVQLVLLAETVELQSTLRTFGLETQLRHECEPVTISSAFALRDALTVLGENRKMVILSYLNIKGLSGRPSRPVGSLSTSKLYRCQGRLYSFLPYFMNSEDFYLVSDNDYLISIFQQELLFIKNNWLAPGRPTMSVMLTEKMLGSIATPGQSRRRLTKRNLFNFMMSLRSGVCGGVRIRLGRLSEMINTSCIESLDFLRNSEQEDWHSILCSYRERPVAANLAVENIPSSVRSRSIKRGRSVRRMSGSGLGLNSQGKPDAIVVANSEEELEIAFSQSRNTDSPVLVLSFGDPSNISEATNILSKSSNVYDQIDLLQYLHSCYGPSYQVEGLGPLSVLIEEVYVKANRLCEWSIVRQAAGLLKKMVNNLSINIAEFLIRKKPVTIGTLEASCTIEAPMTPGDLLNVIYKHCVADIRYSCLVQEIITYLASYIRSNESLFNGMIRIRTHFIIVAMRDEICRRKGCAEVESVELLMAVRYNF